MTGLSKQKKCSLVLRVLVLALFCFVCEQHLNEEKFLDGRAPFRERIKSGLASRQSEDTQVLLQLQTCTFAHVFSPLFSVIVLRDGTFAPMRSYKLLHLVAAIVEKKNKYIKLIACYTTP